MHLREDGLESIFSEAISSGMLCVSDEVEPADAFIICVPTPAKGSFSEKSADLSCVFAAAEMVGKVIKEGDLVVLESTVPPGTSRKAAQAISDASSLSLGAFHFAYCPERVMPGRTVYEMACNDRVIGSARKESALLAKELYKSIAKEGEIIITDDLSAEMCKLVENAYRDVNIAFANEVAKCCDKLGINPGWLISLANRHPRVDILEPGVGVGGHCIPVDPWFLIDAFGSDAALMRQARHINDSKPAYTAQKLIDAVNGNKSSVIGLLGLSYKANTDDLRASPSLELAKILMLEGFTVIACEPNCSQSEIHGVKLFSLSETLSKSDACLLAVKHDAFMNKINEISKAGALVL
jgi:UDP-N-acetyl-D-mannosaminuronic acid dehydrogenase